MQASYLFKGIGVALVTLFHEDGSLDAPATAELAGGLVERGVAGVLVAGTTGEAAALDLDERNELLTAVRKVIDPQLGVPVIAGTGAPTAELAVTYTLAARDAGADAILALSLPGAADQRPYYEAVAQAAGELPLVAYHIPRVSSPGVSLEQLAELPVAALKDSSGDPIRLLTTLATWDKPVYSGSPGLITMAGGVGCAGMILGIANVEPEQCIKAFQGDAGTQLSMAKDIAYTESRFPAALKEVMAERLGTSPVTRVI